MKRSYIVAGHRFSLQMPENEALWGAMEQYAPFAAGESNLEPVFEMELADTIDMEGAESLYRDHPEEGQPPVEILRRGEDWFVKSCCIIKASPDWKKAQFCFNSPNHLFSLNNALMICYAFATATLHTLEMHASVVVNSGKAFLFLARSGTGKSTHSQMWLRAIPGTELLNDDNPIVRILDDGQVMVYGSPWSGKTPCYRNAQAPAGAFVHIKRAPYDKCSPLSTLEGYAIVYSSCSGFKADRKMGDAIHETVSAIAMKGICYTMECLPDEEAARVCSAEVL